MNHPRCLMRAEILTFCTRVEDQCVYPGSHRLWMWPELPICCWHYEGFVNLIHEADCAAAASQLKIHQNGHVRTIARWAVEKGMKAMGTPIDES
jgi:hypothetical protein